MRKAAALKLTGMIVLAALAALTLALASPASAEAARCLGKPATQTGAGAADRIVGSKQADALVGRAGRDRLLGRGGRDRLCGGKGKDKLKGGRGRDRLAGGRGADVLNGGRGRDRANGGPGIDLCLNVEVVRGCERQRPALHFDDQIDWGFLEYADDTTVDPGERVTTEVRVANGITGARGYGRSNVTPRGFLSGPTQVLTFDGDNDDANELVNLPFRFGFFGIGYTQVYASTNGYVTFGAPALDYYGDWRPTAAEMSDFHRGAFPYWSDLHRFSSTLASDPQPGVFSVVRTENAIAFQWRNWGFFAAGQPDRNFQLVLFRDGRIRYDYPGDNDPATGADADEVIALSSGTATRYSEVRREDHTVPGTSILFTPRLLGPVGVAPAGRASAVIPPDTTFVRAATDSRCTLATAPTATTSGLALCRTPVLKPGGQRVFDVAWTAPDPDADLSFAASYRADGFSLTDGEQLLLDSH